MEIFKGSGVKCDIGSWVRANRNKAPSQFVRLLLVGVFDQETLLQSSLKGGQSKLSKDAAPRKPLCDTKVQAIYSKLEA